MRALAVFHGRGAGPFAWALAPGFRHCFVALDDGRYWVVFDGRNGVPDLRVAAAAMFDLAAFYRERGFTVVETETCDRPPPQPLMLGTCVGAAKRLLGLRAPFVLTPRQLWRRLAGAGSRRPAREAGFLPFRAGAKRRGFPRLSKKRLTRGQKSG